MKFESARCELCRQYVFGGSRVIAFMIRDKIMKSVNLNGEEPWLGIRVVCAACREAIHEFPTEIAGVVASRESP